MAPLPPDLTAALAPRYRLDRELGQGGMATVYLAHDQKHDRPVALKVMRPELAAALGSDRFEREIRLAARLQHPHVLAVFDSGEAAGQLWYAMPFVAGESLADRLARTGALPPAEALRIVAEAAQGLAAAHAQGIVHRDIKPANLLLGPDGSTLVADFGIARALAGATTATGAPLTETGFSPGTPAYMSPEQLAGGQDLDARSDVFSLGLVLLEALTGERPGGSSGMPAVLALGADTRVALAPKGAGWPRGLPEVLKRALALDPAARYGSMGEFRSALDALRQAPAGAAPRRPWALVAGILVALAAVGAFLLLRPAGSTPAGPRRIAVLPLADQSPAQDQAWFGDGLADELTTQLGHVPGLELAARGSAFQFRGPAVNLADVGRQLGVQSVVTGSVRKADGKLRVSVQLVDAAAGKELWSDTYDRAAADVFAVQSEIAHAIVTALEVRLTAPTDSALGARATQDLGAYELYLQGRFALGQRTDATIPEAARAFQAAVARDSSFARAWAGLAEAEILLPLYGTATRPADAWRVAEHAARRAIALDSTLVEAHTALAYGTMLYAWDWPAAERAFQRAIAADPRYPTAHHWYADFLAGRGRLDEALAEFTRARALDPLSRIIAVEQAWALANLHRTAEADSVLAGVLRLDPNFAHATLIRAPIRSDQGRYAEALADIRRADELGGFQAYMPAGRVRAFLGLGRRDSAEAEIASLRRRAARGTVPPFAFAAAFAALGEPDSAFAWLDRGIRERDGFLPENFFDRMFTPLATDPRYPPIARLIRGD